MHDFDDLCPLFISNLLIFFGSAFTLKGKSNGFEEES